jgi:ABC-type dipeptide/oligopeptide/nickel transport system ATPase subunit
MGFCVPILLLSTLSNSATPDVQFPPVFETNIIQIMEGECVAIVGPSGPGKYAVSGLYIHSPRLWVHHYRINCQ